MGGHNVYTNVKQATFCSLIQHIIWSRHLWTKFATFPAWEHQIKLNRIYVFSDTFGAAFLAVFPPCISLIFMATLVVMWSLFVALCTLSGLMETTCILDAVCCVLWWC